MRKELTAHVHKYMGFLTETVYEMKGTTKLYFAQVDAFVQRCRDLREVCEGQVQFSRRDNVPESQIRSGEPTEFPAFGASHGPETLKGLQDIESDFQRQVAILAGLPYNILDVKNTEFP